MLRAAVFHHMAEISIGETNFNNKLIARIERCELKVSLAKRIELASYEITRKECCALPFYQYRVEITIGGGYF